MLDYRMETFLSLCETKSYTQTAKRLHLTQPSVTQHVKYLEQFYQCRLFQYDGRQVHLTQAGLYLRDKISVMRVQEMEIQNRLCHLHEDLPLKIGITSSVAHSSILEHLCSFVKSDADPHICLHVAESSALLSELQGCKLDAAVLEGDVFPDAQIEVEKLYQERLIAVASPLLAKQLYGCSWQKLMQQTLFIPNQGSGLRAVLQKQLRSRGIDFYDFSYICHIDSFAVVRELLQKGQGVAFFIESTVRHELATHQLERVYIDTNAAFCAVHFATMRGRLEQEKLIKLRQQLKEYQEVSE